MFMKYFYTVIAIIVGFLFIKYSIALTDWLGKVDWAEQQLRTGMAGTYTLYRLIGLFIIIFALLYLFGAAGFILGPLSPLFGGLK